MSIKIKAPIWKTRSIGIAEYRLQKYNQIEILYHTKDGKRLYPHTYFISKEDALKYPTQVIKGVVLRIIPIIDLKVIKKQSEI